MHFFVAVSRESDMAECWLIVDTRSWEVVSVDANGHDSHLFMSEQIARDMCARLNAENR